MPTGVRAANDNTASKTSPGVTMVSSACPAMVNASYASGAGAQAWGTSEIDNATTIYSSWWCSNGIYKKVTTVGTIEVNANQ